MKGGSRILFWTLFLVGAVVVAALPEWLSSGGETVEAVSRPASPALRTVSLPAEPQADSPARSEGSGMEDVAATDLFAAKTWVLPPPPAPAPPSPSPVLSPSAPPLPFKFMGRLDDGATIRVFLQRGEKAYVVSVGDVIDGNYRVQSIEPGQITLIYLPLDIVQTLSAGSPS